MDTAILLTMLLMGLTGGLHCAGMCGGLVVASERAMQTQVLLPARKLFWGSAQMQGARVASYAALGAIAGWVGSGLWALQARPTQLALYCVGNAVLAASGLWLLRTASGVRWPRLTGWGAARVGWTQGLRQNITRQGIRLLDRILPLSSSQRRFGAGLMWGLLPCGLVYSALSLALLTGSAVYGATTMLAFGLGTLPHMLLAGHVLRRVSQRATARATRVAAAGVMLSFAAWGFWRLLHAGDSLGVHGFCVI